MHSFVSDKVDINIKQPTLVIAGRRWGKSSWLDRVAQANSYLSKYKHIVFIAPNARMLRQHQNYFSRQSNGKKMRYLSGDGTVINGIYGLDPSNTLILVDEIDHYKPIISVVADYINMGTLVAMTSTPDMTYTLLGYLSEIPLVRTHRIIGKNKYIGNNDLHKAMTREAYLTEIVGLLPQEVAEVLTVTDAY